MLDALCEKDILRKAKESDHRQHGFDQVTHHTGLHAAGPFPERHPSTHSEEEVAELKKHSDHHHAAWIESEIKPNKTPAKVQQIDTSAFDPKESFVIDPKTPKANKGESHVQFGGEETKLISGPGGGSRTNSKELSDRSHIKMADVTV